MQDIPFKEWPGRKRASFVNSLSGFRMAYLVATEGSASGTNLAIFNSITHVGSNPPLLGLIFRPLTVERHTYDNIRESGCLTLNTVPLDTIRNAHGTSAKYSKSESEFEKCGFHPDYRTGFRAPYVKESPLRLGCTYAGEYLLSENLCIFMVVHIDWVQVESGAIAEDGFVDHTLLGNTGVIGLETYYSARIEERLSYAQPDEPIKPLENAP